MTFFVLLIFSLPTAKISKQQFYEVHIGSFSVIYVMDDGLICCSLVILRCVI